MARAVFKYPLPVEDAVELELPAGAQLLHVAEQSRELFVWALVDPGAKTEKRHLRVAGTGHELGDGDLRHVGSALMYGGALVFHVFEIRGVVA